MITNVNENCIIDKRHKVIIGIMLVRRWKYVRRHQRLNSASLSMIVRIAIFSTYGFATLAFVTILYTADVGYLLFISMFTLTLLEHAQHF